jgi:hypothetical protein
LLQGVVVVLSGELLKALPVVRAQYRRGTPTVRRGDHAPGVTTPVEKPRNERQADSKQTSDLTQ